MKQLINSRSQQIKVWNGWTQTHLRRWRNNLCKFRQYFYFIVFFLWWCIKRDSKWINLHAKRWENMKWFNVSEKQVCAVFWRIRSFYNDESTKFWERTNPTWTNDIGLGFVLTDSWAISRTSDVFQEDFPIELKFVVGCHVDLFLLLTHPVNRFCWLRAQNSFSSKLLLVHCLWHFWYIKFAN